MCGSLFFVSFQSICQCIAVVDATLNYCIEFRRLFYSVYIDTINNLSHLYIWQHRANKIVSLWWQTPKLPRANRWILVFNYKFAIQKSPMLNSIRVESWKYSAHKIETSRQIMITCRNLMLQTVSNKNRENNV